MSLVPEKDGDESIDMESLRWYHMLCVLEFKKGQSNRKHPREEDPSDRESRKRGSTTSALAHESGADPLPEASGTATRTSAGARASGPVTSRGRGTRSKTSTGARASGAVTSSGRGARTKTSSGARASGAGPSMSSRETLTRPSPTAPSEYLPILRRSQRLVKKSPQSTTVPDTMGPPVPVAQGPPSTEPKDETAIPPATSSPCNDDSLQAGENPTVQASQRVLPTAQRPPGSEIVDDTEVQLANYATEMLSILSNRTFAFGAIVKKTKMQLTYYSRSTYVISNDIDIVKDPVMFAVFLCLFLSQPLDKLGFNKDMGYRNPFNPENEKTRTLNFELDPIDGGDNFKLNPGMKLELEDCIHTEYCLMGRATTVFDVKRPEGCQVDLVLKVQYHPKSRRREDHAILIAREVDPEHSPEIYGIAIMAEKSPSENLKSACDTPPKNKLETREIRVLLMRKYRPIEELNDDEFHEVIPHNGLTTISTDVHALYSERGLLHRDISIANMAFYIKEEKIIGTLIDFDLATFPEQTPRLSGAIPQPSASSPTVPEAVNGTTSSAVGLDTPIVSDVPNAPSATAPLPTAAIAVGNGNNGKGQERSGTTPFMAIESLNLDFPGYVHHLRHELESLLYASVWHAVGYRWREGKLPMVWDEDKNKPVDLLRAWRVGSWKVVVKEKVDFLGSASGILNYINHEELRDKCYRLTKVYHRRAEAIRGIISDISIRRAGTKRQDIIFVNEPIYPYFADIWVIRRGECQKSCCVESTSRF